METNKINYITLQQYLDGMLDKEAMHELEKQALDDPFLADALEGYSAVNKPAARQLSLLQTQLQQRIAQQQEDKNRLSFSWQRLSVAAAACLIFVTATMLFWMKLHPKDPQLASNPKQVNVSLMSKDSLDAVISPQKKTVVPTAPPSPKQSFNFSEDEVQMAVLKPEPKLQNQTSLESVSSPVANDATGMDYQSEMKQSQIGSVSSANAKLSQQLLAGRVVDKKGQPLPGASVMLTNTGNATSTNANGEFNLKDSVGGHIRIAYLGFNSKEVKAEPGTPMVVSLEENSNALNEVVVVGYGASRKVFTKPQPGIGWDKYQQYLEQNIKLPKEKYAVGKVTVAFTVEPDNQLSNFIVVTGLTEDANQEAIRLIKEGPAWQQGQLKTAQVTVEFK